MNNVKTIRNSGHVSIHNALHKCPFCFQCAAIKTSAQRVVKQQPKTEMRCNHTTAVKKLILNANNTVIFSQNKTRQSTILKCYYHQPGKTLSSITKQDKGTFKSTIRTDVHIKQCLFPRGRAVSFIM